MEGDMKVQGDLIAQIKKARANFKKSPKDRLTQTYIETRLDSLELLWKQFVSRHEKIISLYDTEDTPYCVEDWCLIGTDLYMDYKVELKTALSKIQIAISPPISAASRPSESSVKLPTIKIPIFSGRYTEWSSFRDLFTSLVHCNPALDDVQRLHYLKTQLSGEAEQLVKHVTITSDNYRKCWDLLNKRYNNKRFLSNCILKRLFSQRTSTVESANSLKELLDTTTDCLNELNNLGINTDSWDVIIIYIVSMKLDPESRKQWELHISKLSVDLPNIDDFKTFLETRFRALEFVEPKVKPKSVVNNTKVMHVTAGTSCPVCSENHKIYTCKKFANNTVTQRRDIVKSLGLCFNCLGNNHLANMCKGKINCHICKRKHHSLLHVTGGNSNSVATVDSQEVIVASILKDNTLPSVPSTSQNNSSNEISTFFLKGNVRSHVLLATAVVKAESRNGYPVQLRALLDQGSQASFITEATVQMLNLKRIAFSSAISGLGGNCNGLTSKYVVMVIIQSLHDPNFTIEVKAHVLGTLTSVLPEREFRMQSLEWPELQNLDLADPDFNKTSKIDLLLGAEVYSQILQEGLIKDNQRLLMAQNTSLGWILSGQVSEGTSYCHNVIVNFHCHDITQGDMLKKFWELESDLSLVKGSTMKILSPEEQRCEDHFANTTRRDPGGRYIVELPFRDEDPGCKYGNSRNIAVHRLQGLERKFIRDSKFREQYNAVIDDYLQLGHIERVPDTEKYSKCSVYLPHHAVVRNDKTTTKTRVVFDASCKGTNGVSLNDNLLVGPTLQADLRDIVIRWRQHPICLTADIIKMYRQVKVANDHIDFQRFVWRSSVQCNIQDYRLLRVTFGTASAPYLAVKSLQQVAIDEGLDFPVAAKTVLNDFYIDDLMTGVQSEDEAVKLYHELSALLNRGGFQLQKWNSNSNAVLKKLTVDITNNVEIKVDATTKILGLNWCQYSDSFKYTVKLPSLVEPITKRRIVSDISRLFDPLGWIAPCVVTSKIFIQRLWISGMGWDEELPSQLIDEWKVYRNALSKLVKFDIPRWLGTSKGDMRVELHGFSDASNVAYAAVVYVRVITCNGRIRTGLIGAKTKVAPIKQISIPRLELCGAVLLTRLISNIANTLNICMSNVYAWTDSTVVLAWLCSHPSRWKTFVGNRTSEILSTLESSQWSHVRSSDNPADCASRGITPDELLTNQLWKEGPNWLHNEVIHYSRSQTQPTNLEERSVKVHFTSKECKDFQEVYERFSSFRRLIRVIAWCRRFLQLKRPLQTREKLSSYLISRELYEALKCVIVSSQSYDFESDIYDIRKRGYVRKQSALKSLNPFFDDDGMLRVGGRIQQAHVSYCMKHPILIAHNSHLAKLLISDAHIKTLHGGPQIMINFLRSKYWIIRVETLVKQHVRCCVVCIRYSGKSNCQLMGQLPSARITASRPFCRSGVDYAGPISIRVSKGRGNKSYKGYISLFICMATRAIHLEAVSDMTSESFLAAFKRFTARRGHCNEIWSDNGTNFVGASRELEKLFSVEQSGIFIDVASALANNATEWHFIPPHAPNFGGLWEAGIKSTKFHLKRVIGDSTLTYEELATVLTQVEACLNSRPISQISDDADDPYPLTPGHFLIGEPLVIAPDRSYEGSSIGTLQRWHLTQRMVQNFWRRWSQEYISHFMQRYKWNRANPAPKVGDIVIVKEDNLPPAKWLLGKVVTVHPGADGITRVVTLQCKDSMIRRPTSKLCCLPVTE